MEKLEAAKVALQADLQANIQAVTNNLNQKQQALDKVTLAIICRRTVIRNLKLHRGHL